MKKDIRKVVNDLKNDLLKEGKYKTWLLFYKYVQVWFKK